MTYTGLCIGGPRDGEWIAHRYEHLLVALVEKYEPASEQVISAEEIKRFVYKNVELNFGGVPVFVWIEQGKTVHDAMVHMFNEYSGLVKDAEYNYGR